MFAEQILASIEAISADIDRQEEVLKKLKHRKNALRRQLNAVRDPVARLPLEISSEIFIQCLPSHPQPGAGHIPMLLLYVCHAWKEITLGTPALWAAIHLVFPRANGFKKGWETWLERARNHPISISFHNGVASMAGQPAHQLKNLEIYADFYDGKFALPTDMGPLPSLETLTIGSLTQCVYFSRAFSAHQTLKFLRLAPNLRECTFRNFCNGFGKHQFNDGSILKNLTLPALKTLDLGAVAFMTEPFSTDDLFNFLGRSSPPLLELHLRGNVLKLMELEKSFRLVPTLTHVGLLSASRPLLEELFPALAQDTFLPNIRRLSIQSCWPLPASSGSYEALSRALSLRGNPLVLELRWRTNEDAEASRPSADLCAEFRQLVADGMKIYIGTKDRNFISV
ncbi:hypothetical protein B0H17DRAFT_212247 [Mycena rosella]|uniref:F-box domain-containing protein n=1 Tax=Mycena rosella TaxID=1033263 RepID=A0AAD7DVM0_MYCRO|nr:hypothetical protein B0H17DRAFT_212247 [Mycena rosella]